MVGQLVMSGLAAGCAYALVALSFVMIYEATGGCNFAQGDIAMLGGYIAIWAAAVVLPWLAPFLAIALSRVTQFPRGPVTELASTRVTQFPRVAAASPGSQPGTD